MSFNFKLTQTSDNKMYKYIYKNINIIININLQMRYILKD